MNEEQRQQLTEGMLTLQETYVACVESAAGYRARALAAGFSETAAEQMALAYHQLLIQQFAVASMKAAGGNA